MQGVEDVDLVEFFADFRATAACCCILLLLRRPAVSLAMACAAAMVSQETRLTCPCFSLDTDGIVSGFGLLTLTAAQFVSQFVDHFLATSDGDLDVSSSCFLWERIGVRSFVGSVQGALYLRESDLAQVVLRLFDPINVGIAQLLITGPKKKGG